MNKEFAQFKIGDKIMWFWGHCWRGTIVDISEKYYIVIDDFDSRYVLDHECRGVKKDACGLQKYNEDKYWKMHDDSNDPMG